MDPETTLSLILLFGVLAFIFILVVVPKLVFYKKKYSLYRGGPKRLEVKWRADRKKIFVSLDSKMIDTFDLVSNEDEKQGKSLVLPDGQTLHVKLSIDDNASRVDFAPELTMDNKPVPGSIKDPGYGLEVAAKRFHLSGIIILVIAIVFALIVPELASLFLILDISIGIAALWVGVNLKKFSRTALTVGTVLAILNGLFLLIDFLSSLSSSGGDIICGNIFGLLGEWLFIDGLIKGNKAIDYLEKERAELRT